MIEYIGITVKVTHADFNFANSVRDRVQQALLTMRVQGKLPAEFEVEIDEHTGECSVAFCGREDDAHATDTI